MSYSVNSKINVLHIIHSLEFGGAQNVLYSYARLLDRSSYGLDVVTFKPGGALYGAIEELGVPVRCIGSSSSDLRSFLRLASYFRSKPYRIVHFHNPLPVFLGAPAALLARFPVRILTEHSIDYPGRVGNVISTSLYRLLRRTMNIVIACSDEVRKSHSKTDAASRFTVVHNGVDPEKFSPGKASAGLRGSIGVQADQYLIANVGSLTPQKGQSFLLEAAAKIIAGGVPAVLAFVGDGPLRSSLENKAAELGISVHVRFLGRRGDVHDILLAADMAAGSSLREGLSISLLEAMSSGKPVVTTDIGGNREAVTDGRTGFLVPPGNPELLAAAVKRLWSDRELGRRMGSAARKRVEERFSVRGMVQRTEEIYERLLNKGA